MSNKPKCKLTGQNGNIFNLMAVVKTALVDADQRDKVQPMIDEVTSSKSYDEALSIFFKYVDVE